MKYLYSIILTLIIMALPVVTFAAPDPHTNITPPDEYVANELAHFSEYVQRPNLSQAELSEALEDLSQLLSAYADILSRR